MQQFARKQRVGYNILSSSYLPCHYYMGSALSGKMKKKQTISMDSSKISRLYHSKMYGQNIKSKDYFEKQIEAVCKKTSYLSFQWAKDVNHQLQSTKIDQLYSEYQSIFQQNCRRDGRHEVIFYAKQIQRVFLEDITEKYHLKTQILTVTRLKSLIFECKSYLMVMNWLHNISSLTQAKIKESDDCEKQIYIRFIQQDVVYNEIIEIVSKTYVQYLGNQSISKILSRQYELDLKLVDKQLAKEFRKLKKCKSFHEKQHIIQRLQQILLSDDEMLHERIDLIESMFGKSKVFATLFVIKQLGSVDVAHLWRKIYGTKYSEFQC